MELIIVLGFIVVVALIWYIMVFNSIKSLGIKIEESFANIDVALVKRYHVLTQMFEVAKGYAKHERDVLEMVVELRKGMSLDEKVNANAKINQGFDRLFAVAESYPELKADTLFLNLQNAAFDSEEHLQAARRLHNANVTRFNTRIETFPGNYIADSMQEKRRNLLEFEHYELQNVQINTNF